jgi:soluble lytic murein transglycosylase-like protein
MNEIQDKHLRIKMVNWFILLLIASLYPLSIELVESSTFQPIQTKQVFIDEVYEIQKEPIEVTPVQGYIDNQLTERDMINQYIVGVAEQYSIEPELIMSIIEQESGYDVYAKNGNCLGLMQVSSRWHSDRATRLGVSDFYNPYSNILVGVDYLSDLLKNYTDPSLALMLYSMDNKLAIKMYSEGRISNYAKTVLARAESYKKGE